MINERPRDYVQRREFEGLRASDWTKKGLEAARAIWPNVNLYYSEHRMVPVNPNRMGDSEDYSVVIEYRTRNKPGPFRSCIMKLDRANGQVLNALMTKPRPERDWPFGMDPKTWPKGPLRPGGRTSD